MPVRRSRPKISLRHGLDKEVYQVIRKSIDEHEQFGDGSLRLNFAQVYDTIRRSNSSLNRKNKKLLEDSIERVLEAIDADHHRSDGSDSVEEGSATLEASTQSPPDSIQTNGINRSIVGMWSNTPPSSREAKKVDGAGGQLGTSGPASPVPISNSSKRRNTEDGPSTKKRKAAAIDMSPLSHISLADMGGVDNVIHELEDMIVLPMTRPQVYIASKIQPPRGVLLHGPPGCGKTMIANAFAAELDVNFITMSAPSIVSGMSGESEKALRDYFDEAKKAAPCLIFIDEIDAITPKRESAQREMEKRIVAQLLTCMDDLSLEKTDGKPVIVLAATNRPDSLDAALRRGGRFDKEINMSVPSEPIREQILRALTREMTITDDVDFAMLAKQTPGFVGADLSDLVSTAGATAIKRYLSLLKSDAAHSVMDTDPSPTTSNPAISPTITSLRQLIAHAKTTPSLPTNSSPSSPSSLPPITLTASDFHLSLPRILPSSKREGFATVPDTTFSDIGALTSTISELYTSIINPILRPALYTSLGIAAPTGLLLWGPPGCGKTLLAKAVANASHANFISIKGPELLNKFVGESERAVRQVFVRARSSVPCVVFFDELDALVPRRSGSDGGGGGGLGDSSARVVNTLLTELDGLGPSREGVYVIAATNRPDIIDPAMLRPGRLETVLFVDLPGEEERVEILRTLCRKVKIAPSTKGQESEDGKDGCKAGGKGEFPETLNFLARSCHGFSGADLGSLLRRAGYAAIRRLGAEAPVAAAATGAGGEGEGIGITVEDFLEARKEVEPSVKERDLGRYRRLRREWGGVGSSGSSSRDSNSDGNEREA